VSVAAAAIQAVDRLLTPDEVGKRLTVSRSMIYTLIKRGELRALYVGRLPRITEAALAAYLATAESRITTPAGRPKTPEHERGSRSP
jgi:excisionase family DNA binding protein